MNQEMILAAAREAAKQLYKQKEVKISLPMAKELTGRMEEKAKELGISAVFAVCNAQGNMICVEAMDDAYIVSFDVAMRKAYTAVAVQMPTLELGKLAAPGETFYGVDKAEDGKLMLIGGGIPLIYNGVLYGGLGVSGSTGEVDHDMAYIGSCYFTDMMNRR